MARKNQGDILKAKRYIAKLLYIDKNEGIIGRENKPSPTKIKEVLERDLSLKFDRKTIMAYLEEDLTKHLNEETEQVVTSDEIQEYNDLMDVAKKVWDDIDAKPSDRSKMAKVYLDAKKQKEIRLKQLEEIQIKRTEVKKPVHLLKFFPQNALHKCPKCGEEFYDNFGNKKEENNEDTNKN